MFGWIPNVGFFVFLVFGVFFLFVCIVFLASLEQVATTQLTVIQHQMNVVILGPRENIV